MATQQHAPRPPQPRVADVVTDIAALRRLIRAAGAPGSAERAAAAEGLAPALQRRYRLLHALTRPGGARWPARPAMPRGAGGHVLAVHAP